MYGDDMVLVWQEGQTGRPCFGKSTLDDSLILVVLGRSLASIILAAWALWMACDTKLMGGGIGGGASAWVEDRVLLRALRTNESNSSRCSSGTWFLNNLQILACLGW